MNQIDKNYVCLSDLHLGAKYSVFSSRDDKTGLYQSNQNPDCLVEFVTRLRSFVPKAFESDAAELPTLIILGDLLDFSFGTTDDIVNAFTQLIQLLFGDDTPLFDSEIIYVPGNHDHRIWQSTKDQLVLENYLNQKNSATDKNSNQSTPLYRTEELSSNLLNALAKQVNKNISVNLRYPNMGLRSTLNQREVYLHHGHYIESAYRLMTIINQLISEIDDPDVEELERQNGGWIDFFWSSLGASAVQKDNAVLLFDVMQNPAASQQYAKKLARLCCDYLSQQYAISPTTPLSKHITLEKMVTGFIHSTLGRAFELERAAFHEALSKDGLDGLAWYLANPLRNQILEASQNPDKTSELDIEASFIFGHTHKPFQDKTIAKGFKRPLNVFNCGGWVVDTPGYSSMQGGAVVFIDKALNIVSLRVFQAPVNQQMPIVNAQGLGDKEDENNPLLKRMQAILIDEAESWLHLQTLIKEAVDLRAKEARDKFFDPSKSPGVKS